MAKCLIIAGIAGICLVLVSAGPLAGYAIHRRRQASNTEFIAQVQESRSINTTEMSFPELGEELNPERYFWENPLGSYVLPANLDEGMPIFDEAFEALAASRAITGVGVDVVADWEDWNLDIDFAIAEIFKKELVEA